MTRRWLPALALLVGIGAWAHADPAAARRAPNKFKRQGGYLHLKPGVLALDVERTQRLGYQYGLGGGGFWPTRGGFAFAVGADFEHWLYLHERGDVHIVSAGPELRLGGSGRRFFAYALVGANLNFYVLSNYLGYFDDSRVGVGFPLGGGISGLITDSFYMGVEGGPDINLLFRESLFGGTDVDVLVILNVKALLGWRF